MNNDKYSQQVILWEDYLNIMDMMAQIPGVYHLDSMRESIHNDLFDYYSERFGNISRNRFDLLCHNLDVISGVTIGDKTHGSLTNIKYADEIDMIMNRHDMRGFLTGAYSKVQLERGVIDGENMKVIRLKS